jgi:hypothetical protein
MCRAVQSSLDGAEAWSGPEDEEGEKEGEEGAEGVPTARLSFA